VRIIEIKIRDGLGSWHNLELTNHAITSNEHITYSGYVKAEAIANQVYMHPLTAKQAVAQTAIDLVGAYVKQYGYGPFVLDCTRLAIRHGVKSMPLHMHNFNYYLTLHNHVLGQYEKHGLTEGDFRGDKNAMHIYGQVVGAHKHMEKQGYVDMPPEEYEKWLGSVKNEANKQEHKTRMRSLMGQLQH